MAITQPNEFPWVAQETYVDLPLATLPGDCWEGDLFNERQTRGLIAQVTPVAQVTEVLIGANNPGDSVGVTIDGGLIQVTAGASANATALLLEAAIEAAAFLTDKIASVTVDTATVTITFSDYDAHTVVEYSPDATTATVTEDTAAVGQQRLLFGMGVVRQAVGDSANFIKIVKPTSLTQTFAGVLMRTPSSDIPPDQIMNLGFDPEYLCPGYAYTVAAQNLGVVVKYIGTAPTMTDPVYLIMSGTNAGHWRINDGGTAQVTRGDVVSNYNAGTAQVTRGDVTFNGTDDVGLIVDSLPTLFVASNTSDDQTATDLRDAWNASAQHFAVATATIDLSGAESYIILTFKDTASHTVTAYSPATADVVSITDTTAAVAAVADAVGLIVDSLPTLSVASITDDDTTAAALRDAWNASAQHAAIATASINTAGAESYIVLTFLDNEEHTVTAYSPATADVVSITDTTTAVAASAVLIPGYSWGRPSVTSGDTPRAFLRLNNP